MTLKQQVECALQDKPETRNSDIALTIAIWKMFYPQKIKRGATGQDGIWLEDLYDLPREDNVKRLRAEFNAEGKYWPTELKIVLARGLNEDRWRKALGYPPKQDTTYPSKEESYTSRVRTGEERIKCGECAFYAEKTMIANMFQCPKGHVTKTN